MRASARFSIFDAMDAKGVFTSNPANADSFDPVEHTSLYSGPVAFPKMMYHPQGERRVLVQGEVVLDRDGQPRVDRKGNEIVVNRQEEIIWRIVSDADEEASLRDAGWHDHPAKAIAAAGGEAPAISSAQHIADLEAQLARANAALAEARATPTATGSALKKIVSSSVVAAEAE